MAGDGEMQVSASPSSSDVLRCGADANISAGAASEASFPVGKSDSEALSALLDVGVPADIADSPDTQRHDPIHADNPAAGNSPEMQRQCMHVHECQRYCTQI